ncbi:MAG: hypothetical protein QW372_05775 [Nitrososphaerales archaeon]
MSKKIFVSLILLSFYLGLCLALYYPEPFSNLQLKLTSSINQFIKVPFLEFKPEYIKIKADYENLQEVNKAIQEKYYELQNKISKLEFDYENLQKQFDKVQKTLSQLTSDYNSLKERYSDAQNTIEQLQLKLSTLEKGTLYRNPTYQEVKKFLKEDKTNEKRYIPNVYTCEDFSADVNNNAEKIGFRCGFVILHFKGTEYGHALIVFETIDRDLIYIEPQNDKEVKVALGVRYWIDNGFEHQQFDDTIVKITIVW